MRFEGNNAGVYYRYDCIIASEWDPTGDIFMSAIDSNSTDTCGGWSYNGYGIRHSSIALPQWVSAPAVLYDGYATAYLNYAVVLPNGDQPDSRRSAWRSSLVSVMVDQSGPYNDIDSYIVYGTRFNCAPLVIRDAWGAGRHAIAVGGSDGNLYMFRAGLLSRGPYIVHTLSSLLPSSSPLRNNLLAGVSGNYMGASSGGSIAMVMHNGTNSANQEYWFAVVTGAMFPLPTDVIPSASPSSAPLYPSPVPNPDSGSGNAKSSGVNIPAAVFGTLGGLAVAAGAIVLFLPTAGFMLGSKLIVPADLIKSGASATWRGASWAGRGVAGAVSGAMGGGGASATSFQPTAYTAVGSSGGASEGASLLRK